MVLEKEGTMVVKSDSASASIGKRPANHPKKSFHAADLPGTATMFIWNVCLLILLGIAVLIGLPGSRENLERIGIHIGPNHL
jgi:dolichol kinase